MPPETDRADRIRLRHMLDAARQAIEFATDRQREQLDSDLMFRRAVVHCIQEIGEAAWQVTEGTRVAVPDVPWSQIVAMRHRLVHTYFAINEDMVWEVIQRDLPPLIQALREALQREGG